MRSNLVVVAISQLLLISNTAAAQKDSVPFPARESSPARAWIIPVGIVTSAVLDPEMREWALHTHSRSLDRLAKSVNPIGTTRILVPGMALTYVGALLTRDESLANGTLNTAAAYIASDVVESVLKVGSCPINCHLKVFCAAIPAAYHRCYDCVDCISIK